VNKQADSKKNRLLTVVVVLFTLASIVFLFFKLSTYPDYDTLLHELKSLPKDNFKWLIFTLLLLPFNWLTESVKWKVILSETQKINLKLAFKSVLAGFTTGFFTPNRLGDFAGRIYFLDSSNRKTGITLSLINSLTQNIAIALFGIPAAFIFFSSQRKESMISPSYFVLLVIILILLLAVFLLLPSISKKIKSAKISEFLKGINNFSKVKLLSVLLLSILRFGVFSLQFYTLLRFFGIPLSANEAILAILSNYLFVTFTPSIGLTDPVIRSSYALFFIGTFSGNMPGIVLSGTGIWLINQVISMLVGNIFIFHKTRNTV